jgi:hypothetical protein
MANTDTFLALADFLIPAYKRKPSFGSFCSYNDALQALGFRSDLREAFERALLAVDMKEGPEPALEKLNAEDGEAFSALTTIVIATYYMNPKVRESIGYPGQENVSYDSKATQSYLLDGSLARVIARGRKYRPTPGL